MRRLGQYELEEQVAEGSTGVVFRARHVELQTVAAVKVLRPELRDDRAVVARFRQEARTLAGLDHPGIVRIHNYGEDAGEVWLALEWVDGAPLDDVLDARGRLSAEQAVGVVRDALQGLEFAHGLDVVHGDVATSNVLLSTAGRSMLVDFGLACPVGSTGVSGTPAFVSPEAASGGVLTTRSDVWSAGAVLYLLMSGAPVLPGSDVATVLRRHREDEPKRLTGHGPELADVLAKAMAKEPAARYPEAGAFLRALEDAAERHFGAGWLAAASVVGLAAGVGTAGSVAVGGAVAAGSSVAGSSAAADATTVAAVDTGTPAVTGGAPAAATPPAPAPRAPAHPHTRPLRRVLRAPKAPAALAVAVVVAAVVGTTIVVTRSGHDSSLTLGGGGVTPLSTSLPTGKPTGFGEPGTGVVASSSTYSLSAYLGRLSCPAGGQVASAQVSVMIGRTTTVVPLVYVGSDVWQADLTPVTGNKVEADNATAQGTCGDATPSPSPDGLRMAGLDFEGPSGLTGSDATVQFVAKPNQGGGTGCPLDAPVANMFYVHGYSSGVGTLDSYELGRQAGMTATPMRPVGDGSFVVDLIDRVYSAESSRDVPGKVYTEAAYGSCDFTKTPPATSVTVPTAVAGGG